VGAPARRTQPADQTLREHPEQARGDQERLDAHIDQTHDRAVQVAKDFAAHNPDTLVIVTADHECSGAAIIGASKVTDAALVAGAGSGVPGLRNAVVEPRRRRIPQVHHQRWTALPRPNDNKMPIGYGGMQIGMKIGWLTRRRYRIRSNPPAVAAQHFPEGSDQSIPTPVFCDRASR
jgi:hypothetical protein